MNMALLQVALGQFVAPVNGAKCHNAVMEVPFHRPLRGRGEMAHGRIVQKEGWLWAV